MDEETANKLGIREVRDTLKKCKDILEHLEEPEELQNLVESAHEQAKYRDWLESEYEIIGKKIKTKHLNYPTNKEPWIGTVIDQREVDGEIEFKVKRIDTSNDYFYWISADICEIIEEDMENE